MTVSGNLVCWVLFMAGVTLGLLRADLNERRLLATATAVTGAVAYHHLRVEGHSTPRLAGMTALGLVLPVGVWLLPRFTWTFAVHRHRVQLPSREDVHRAWTLATIVLALLYVTIVHA